MLGASHLVCSTLARPPRRRKGQSVRCTRGGTAGCWAPLTSCAARWPDRQGGGKARACAAHAGAPLGAGRLSPRVQHAGQTAKEAERPARALHTRGHRWVLGLHDRGLMGRGFTNQTPNTRSVCLTCRLLVVRTPLSLRAGKHAGPISLDHHAHELIQFCPPTGPLRLTAMYARRFCAPCTAGTGRQRLQVQVHSPRHDLMLLRCLDACVCVCQAACKQLEQL